MRAIVNASVRSTYRFGVSADALANLPGRWLAAQESLVPRVTEL
jgi:hypothetical protein